MREDQITKVLKVEGDKVIATSQDPSGEDMNVPLKSLDGNYCMSAWFYLQIYDELARCSAKDLGPLP